MVNDYSKGELIACVIARELKNDDTIAIGLHAELMMAASLLSQKIYSPDLKIRHGLRSDRKDEIIELNPAAWTLHKDSNSHKIIEYHEEHESILTLANLHNPNLMCDTFFVGGLQIDKKGSTNLIGIKSEDPKKKFKVRGPGSIGTTSVAELSKKYYLFTLHHTKRIFVDKVDYISTAGYIDDSKKGPELCITPLCVFNFKDGVMNLKSIHPGHNLEEVKENTGFEFAYDNYEETVPPSDNELSELRKIDFKGELNKIIE